MTVKRPVFAPVPEDVLQLFSPATLEGPPPPDGPFRIGELSAHSGIPVGTIKFYLREGLLPPGRATAKTQALYGTDHLRRLRLIRVLVEVGDLSIAQVRSITAMLDAGAQDDERPGELDQTVSYALEGGVPQTAAAEVDARAPEAIAAREATDAFIDAIGLNVDAASPGRADLGEALLALRTLGIADDPVVFMQHARLAYELAEFETGTLASLTDRTQLAEAITVGSVIFGAAFTALRQMGQEHATRVRLGVDDDCD